MVSKIKSKKTELKNKSSKGKDKEIANLLKESLEKPRKNESELEENVKSKKVEKVRNVNLGNMDFHKILDPDDFDSGSPVLEKVASSGPRPIFVGSPSQTTREEEEEREIRYSAGSGGKDDPKYFDASTEYAHSENFDFAEVNGVNRSNEMSAAAQEAIFGRVKDPRLDSQSAEPRVWNPDRFDPNSDRKEQKYKFKIPKV